jgi:hypothetical protein
VSHSNHHYENEPLGGRPAEEQLPGRRPAQPIVDRSGPSLTLRKMMC